MTLRTIPINTGLRHECSSLRIISAQAEENQTLLGSSPCPCYKALDSFIFKAFNFWTLE